MITLHLPYLPSGWDLLQRLGQDRRPSPSCKKWRNDAGYSSRPEAGDCQPSLCFRRQNMRQHLTNAQKGFSTAFSTTASSRTTISADA